MKAAIYYIRKLDQLSRYAIDTFGLLNFVDYTEEKSFRTELIKLTAYFLSLCWRFN